MLENRMLVAVLGCACIIKNIWLKWTVINALYAINFWQIQFFRSKNFGKIIIRWYSFLILPSHLCCWCVYVWLLYNSKESFCSSHFLEHDKACAAKPILNGTFEAPIIDSRCHQRAREAAGAKPAPDWWKRKAASPYHHPQRERLRRRRGRRRSQRLDCFSSWWKKIQKSVEKSIAIFLLGWWWWL